jgi:hypothetical protein
MNFYEIDGVKLPFDKKWNSVAISLSGGADSALLAFLLCSIAPQGFHFHIISHIRCWKEKPWQQYDGLNVYRWLVNRFTYHTFERYTNFISPDLEYGKMGPNLIDEYGKQVSGDNIEIRSFAEYICFQKNIDAYYNAVTRNPRLANFNGMLERDIEPTTENEHLYMMKHMDRWAIHPFRFTDKSWVIKQYKENNLEDLLELTRSCEGTFKELNYKNYTPGQYVPVCGKCFWCKERKWAIEHS